MVSEQDRKIRDSEAKKGGDGAGRQKKDAGKGPDQGCLTHVPYDKQASLYIHTIFCQRTRTLDTKTLVFVTVVILIKAECLNQDMCSMAAGIDVGHHMSRI